MSVFLTWSEKSIESIEINCMINRKIFDLTFVIITIILYLQDYKTINVFTRFFYISRSLTCNYKEMFVFLFLNNIKTKRRFPSPAYANQRDQRTCHDFANWYIKLYVSIVDTRIAYHPLCVCECVFDFRYIFSHLYTNIHRCI
jgi:hypothetical protein